MSFLTGLTELPSVQHAAQRPEVPHSFNLKTLSSISTGITLGFRKLYTTLNVCFVSLLVLCLSSSEDVGEDEGEARGILLGPE